MKMKWLYLALLAPFFMSQAQAQGMRPSYCADASCAASIGAQVVGMIDAATGRPVALSSASPLPVAGVAVPATGSAAASSSITAGSYQTVFAAGSITRGCSVQNPSGNTVSLWVDFAGATGASRAATSVEVVPGASIRCDFVPTGAVTAFAASSLNFNALRW
ncbi:putative exported protein [Granulibacter bethesdensis]|uniref:Exported protein n=2 Tax=Granulibacter bethesdensis TaxID=364410 RepID=A0AAN0RED1_9PROT|nr:putative exported protein [Granulibacter bethesdensis]